MTPDAPIKGSIRLVVFGGRDLDPMQVFDWLKINAARQILKTIDCKGKRITHVIHGYARGADYGGMMYGRDWLSAEILGFKANWFADGKAAGPLRNQRMIDEGKPDVAIAFPGGRGTADMTRRCEAAKIPIVRAEL